MSPSQFRLVFISNLFPNRREPQRGLFNAQQITALAHHTEVARIIAPVETPLADEVHKGIPVTHPHFFHLPVITRPWNGFFLSRALAPQLRHRNFDCVLVNWAYPDAYAVMLVAQHLNFPFATTVQGSDVNLLFNNPRRKQQILQTLRASIAVFARSEALRKKLKAEGVEATTVYNGVNRRRFRPIIQDDACRTLRLPLNHRRILYVGNLLKVKGPIVLAEAFRQLSDIPDLELIFLGSGPEAAKIPTNERVKLLGSQPHDRIPLWMNASDVLCLPSFKEGLPNVCIEAAACGTPVVASNIGGVPEVIKEGINGFLVPPGDPGALSYALRRAITTKWNRNAIVSTVSQFDWNNNAQQVLAIIQSAIKLKTTS